MVLAFVPPAASARNWCFGGVMMHSAVAMRMRMDHGGDHGGDV